MTEEQEIQHNPTLDERVATFLSRRSQKLSRRGAMATVGRTLLRLSGLAVLPLLPSSCKSPGGTCGWTTCGMCGNFCSTSCCGGTGGVSRCPTCSGMTVGGAWTFCCYNPTTCNCHAGFMFTYTDCLATTTTLASQCKDPTFCETPPTGNCAGQGGLAYGGFYSCTTVVQGGPCDACNNGVQPH